jgi:septum formation protein
MDPTLVLASASPRRSELLARIGIRFDVAPSDVDESPRPGEAPEPYALRIATEKAEVARLAHPGRAVLAADTVVTIDGDLLGKAVDPAEAAAMLRRLVGRTHAVVTAFVLIAGDGRRTHGAVRTEVDLRAAADDEIADYAAAGEWRGKAGAYASQGMAAAWVLAMRGSVTNVIGLPLAEVVVALADLGVTRLDFRAGQPA